MNDRTTKKRDFSWPRKSKPCLHLLPTTSAASTGHGRYQAWYQQVWLMTTLLSSYGIRNLLPPFLKQHRQHGSGDEERMYRQFLNSEITSVAGPCYYYLNYY